MPPAPAAAIMSAKMQLRRAMLKRLKGMSPDEVGEQSRRVAEQLFQQPFWTRSKRVGCYLSMQHAELQTDLVVQRAFDEGKQLYIPYIPFPPSTSFSQTASRSKRSETHSPNAEVPPSLPAEGSSGSTPSVQADGGLMRMLRLYSAADLQRCERDKWGIPDPTLERKDGDHRVDKGKRRADVLDEDEGPLDLILIPGVAFDRQCNRLGRGKGYYDRFLSAYTASRERPLLVALALTPQLLPGNETVPTDTTDFMIDGVLSPAGMMRPTPST